MNNSLGYQIFLLTDNTAREHVTRDCDLLFEYNLKNI